MRGLLDVNVPVALLDQHHVNHLSVHQWLDQTPADGWASCPLTENACLRLLTNPRHGSPVTPGVALAKLDESKRGGNHAFWADDVSITDSTLFDWNRLQGHQQVTDVYLLAVARGGRLVTFDRGIRIEAVRASRPEHLATL